MYGTGWHTAAMAETGRAAGSNQYRARLAAVSVSPVHLLDQLTDLRQQQTGAEQPSGPCLPGAPMAGTTVAAGNDLLGTPLDALQVETRMVLARDPAASPALLAALTESRDWSLLLAVLGNPNCPAALLLDALDEHQDHAGTVMRCQVAALVAGHHNTPPETLVRLLQHPAPEVRRAAQENPSLSRYALALQQFADPRPAALICPFCRRPMSCQGTVYVCCGWQYNPGAELTHRAYQPSPK